jgi:hypothetical protein
MTNAAILLPHQFNADFCFNGLDAAASPTWLLDQLFPNPKAKI